MSLESLQNSIHRLGWVGSLALRAAKTLLRYSFRLLPEEMLVRRDGISYRLDTRDDLQQLIFLNAYESAEIQLLKRIVPVNGVCVDVGANIGFFTLHLASIIGQGGKLYAFEPDTANAARLRDNVVLNGFGKVVTVLSLALGSEGGSLPFYRSRGGHSGWGSLAKYADLDTEESVVQTETFDSFCAASNLDFVDFLKVDIEGMEFEFLAGARRMLGTHKVANILIEYNGPRLSERGHSPQEMLTVFEEFGYTLADSDQATAALNNPDVWAAEIVNLFFTARQY